MRLGDLLIVILRHIGYGIIWLALHDNKFPNIIGWHFPNTHRRVLRLFVVTAEQL